MNGTRDNKGRLRSTVAPRNRRRGAPPANRQAVRRHSTGRHNNASANAQRNYERYLALARDAASSGDIIEMENCYQHAEHYFRVTRERA